MTAVRASRMITCLADVLLPEVGVALVALLRRLGVAVDFPPGETCCGLPLFIFVEDGPGLGVRPPWGWP
jgi:Fe-S oxidoreductase